MDHPIPLISPSLTLIDNAFLQRWRQRIVRLNLWQHCLLSVLGHEKLRSFSLSKDLRNAALTVAINKAKIIFLANAVTSVLALKGVEKERIK